MPREVPLRGGQLSEVNADITDMFIQWNLRHTYSGPGGRGGSSWRPENVKLLSLL
jgi:hypothetical protein